ncbi:hypothetical protein WA026_015934 [Henosepilachna vigintioctopunctata]|uniref:RNA polymerase II-associated protein 1 n=1 Tax=Henosepilachna vigintioctopunctata TaxID=420089 RepID=A0AAW1U795_9CUCU
MYSRPKPEESDEDLMTQEEEFLTKLKEKKIKPAAKVEALYKKETAENINITESVKDVDIGIQQQLANTFESIPAYNNIKQVVEKRRIHDVDGIQPLVFSKGGFPKAKRRDVNVKCSSKSIFSQHMKKSTSRGTNKTSVEETNKQDSAMNINILENNINLVADVQSFVKGSNVLSEADKDEIHEKNINLLKTTPESEILEERERLLSTMDPALLAFIKAKARKQKPKNTNPSILQQNEAGRNINVENIKTTSDILQKPGAENWLNFDLLEVHKLAWMEEITLSKIDKNKALDARFDFEGWLLPFTESEVTDANRILYHHGEEPDRPGYTLQELFTLARSSVIQQKIIALNSIANILSLYSIGVYQDILEIPIEQIFFLVRFCMDDNTPGVLNASVKALRCLVYNHIDEICLDSLYSIGWENMMPILPVDHDKEDDNTVNDQQLAEKNLIRCLVRTGIYTRIRYIINTIKPSTETLAYCLEILIRLAKDSEFVVGEMLRCENLMSSIVKYFVPSSIFYNSESAYGTPILQAVKLIRVMCCRSKTIAIDLTEKYDILNAISNYLQDEVFGANVNGMRLQTECFYLWKSLLDYNLQFQHTSILVTILLRFLNYHLRHTNIGSDTTYVREGHCSATLTLIANVLKLKPSLITEFESLIQDCLSKWFHQFYRLESFKYGNSQIMSSTFYLCTVVYGYSKLVQLIDGSISHLMKSPGFFKATNNMRQCSMLLNNYEVSSYSTNMKTLQTSAWYTADHIIPILQTSSAVPLVSSLSHFVSETDNYSVKLSFITHPNIKQYIESLEKQKSLFLINHWFTRIESRLIMNILKISFDVQKDIDTSLFYSLAVKALSVFNTEQKIDVNILLEKIIFCPNFYPTETLMNNLELDKRNESLEISLNNLNEILQVYSEVFGLKSQEPLKHNLCVDIGVGNMIPIDWVYAPILSLYSNEVERKKQFTEEHQILVVRNCLRWILIYETYFPSLVEAVNPTDRFCRLACVLLGSDGLFLNNEIHCLLELCLKNILEKFEDELDFDKPIQGLTNFQDFYSQILEQYQGVSYGDILFGNFVLVPLKQKQNVQWRKTLWSEYMGVVHVLNVCQNQLMTKLSSFLYPPEEDESLLKCYKIALGKGTIQKNSVLYAIATHHYKEYMQHKSSRI